MYKTIFFYLDDETTEILSREIKWLKKLDVNTKKPINVDIPEKFLCPITHEIMMEPVSCCDGFTYEKNAIAEWFMSGKYTSPMTNETLSKTDFTQNLEIRDAIRKFIEAVDDDE